MDMPIKDEPIKDVPIKDGPIPTCPECGAPQYRLTCQEHFHQMLYWENQNPANGEVHHLTVLCFYIQHPSLYSPEGLKYAHGLLERFIETGVSPSEVRQQEKTALDSGRRTWKVKGTAARHAAYQPALVWTMTAADVTEAGEPNYRPSVKRWTHSIYKTLKQAGYLAHA